MSILYSEKRLYKGEEVMLYLMMCYFNENRWNEMPEQQRDKVLQEYHQLIQQTIAGGQHRAGAMLHPVITATTIRAKDGRVVINDGPFAETKEQLGGYHLMECENLDEAISIASRIPTIPIGGTIEIRPVAMLEKLT
jgi:hypothetical protein